MNPEDLPEYIWPFIHLFNRLKFDKLLERREWDHEINLLEDTLKELNIKAYTMIVKKDEVLNQWLEEQLMAEFIMESSSRYVTLTALCFYILKKDGFL